MVNLIRNQNQQSNPINQELQSKTDKLLNTSKRVSSFFSQFTFHTLSQKKSNHNLNSLSINPPESRLRPIHQDQIISPNSDLSSNSSPLTPNNDLSNQIHIIHDSNQYQSSLANDSNKKNPSTSTTSYFQFPTNSNKTPPINARISVAISSALPTPIDSHSTLTTQSSRYNLTRSTSVLTDESQSLPSSSSSLSTNKPAFIKALQKLNERSSSSLSLSSPTRQTQSNQSNQISKASSLTPLWESEYVQFPSTKAALEGFVKYRGTLLKHTPPAQPGFWNNKSSKVWKTALCCLTSIYPHNHPTVNNESTLYNLHIFNSPSPAQADLESARLRLEASSIVCVLENNMAGESLVLKITGREVTKNADTSQMTETQTSWMFAMEDVSHLKTWMKTFKEIVNELRQSPNDSQPPLSASTTRSISSMSRHSRSTILDSPTLHQRVPSRQTNINPSPSSLNSIRSATPNFFGPTSLKSATPKPKSEGLSPVKSQSLHQPYDAFLETLRTEESQYKTSPLIRSQSSILTKSHENASRSSSSSSSSTSLFSLQNSLPCPPRRASRSLHPNTLKIRPVLSDLIITRPNTVSSKSPILEYEQDRILTAPLIPPPTAALPPIPDECTEKNSVIH
ncbi:hypothetical protein DFH28DRAFT_924641 [Melampsora americana]|nr:hypothetical protein DFH28DRAFT_924641 [Melampsora americana]